MIDFLIFYEVAVREFESIIALGHELKKRGYSVEYIGFNRTSLNDYVNNQKLIKRYFNNVKVAIMPSLYHDKELYSTVYYVCGKCTQVVNIRWEQYFSNKAMDDNTDLLYPRGGAREAYHLCWGKRSYETMRAADVPDENLLQAGPMHMDFLRPEFSEYYLSKQEIYKQYCIPEDKKTILFISSFAGATATERQFAGNERDFDGEHVTNYDAVSFTRASYYRVLSWVEELVQTNKDIVFVYRPHPSENISDELEKLQNTYENLRIIPDHSVKQWIKVCDRLVTWVSTSIVEAFFANKPCTIVRPLPYKYEDDMCIYQNAEFITTKEEFLNVMKQEAKTSVSSDLIYHYYDFGEIASFIRLAAMLEDVYNSSKSFPWNDEYIRKFEQARPKIALRSVAVNGYRMALKVLDKINKLTKIKYPHFIESRLENYRVAQKKKIYDKMNVTSFEQIQERLYRILDAR